MLIELGLLRLDGGTQVRAQLDQGAIEDYADAMRAGAVFPPVVAFQEGADYWLADGFHRAAAAKLAGLEKVEAEVRAGSKDDALRYAVGANATNSVRRSNEDKNRAVELAFTLWPQASDREIADHACVSHPFVSKVRKRLTGNGYQSTATKVGRDGRAVTSRRAKVSQPTVTVSSDDREATPPVSSPAVILPPGNGKVCRSCQGSGVEPEKPAPPAPGKLKPGLAPVLPTRKRLCDRCQRVGVSRDCPRCKAL